MQNSTRSFSLSDVRINNRSSIDISGVEEVISYDERSIVLVVCGVKMIVEGDDLRVTELSVDDGRVCAIGKIGAVLYEEGTVKKSGFLSSIFKG